MNAFGRTLAEARRFMAETTSESERQIETETLHYSTDLPGQALAYRLGRQKLWNLRGRAGAAGCNVRDFHEVVLAPGALPLSAVEANVDAWLSYTSGGMETR
ncbi:DUF885 family protein [Nonomuraea sp. KM90]|uniref:DUF885 family protein n=1 Tax=Nonomuraea sp. KM90 TaxID=3457428 RepID=UPI003FCC5BA8